MSLETGELVGMTPFFVHPADLPGVKTERDDTARSVPLIAATDGRHPAHDTTDWPSEDD